MNENEGRQRLAAAVRADRMRIYRTVDKARVAAGVSRGAWDNVEAGKSVKDFTLGAIEEALDWPAGKAQSILNGDPQAPRSTDELIAEMRTLNLPADLEREFIAAIEQRRAALDHTERGAAG